jgi:ketosteroid isomerase-like protein
VRALGSNAYTEGLLSHEDIEIFWRGMEAFNGRDFDVFLELFHEEIEFFPLRSAIEGSYSGLVGVRKWWKDTGESWETFQIEADTVHDLGDGRIVAAGVIHAKGKGGGVPLDIPTSWLTEYHEGLIRKIKFFFDRDEAFTEVGLSGRSAVADL